LSFPDQDLGAQLRAGEEAREDVRGRAGRDAHLADAAVQGRDGGIQFGLHASGGDALGDESLAFGRGQDGAYLPGGIEDALDVGQEDELRGAKGGGGTRAGLQFPGDREPGYGDFLYYSLVIGCACATADVETASRVMRLTTMVHCVVAFFFNTIILALTINIGAGLV
jgi:hypothetical protein